MSGRGDADAEPVFTSRTTLQRIAARNRNRTHGNDFGSASGTQGPR